MIAFALGILGSDRRFTGFASSEIHDTFEGADGNVDNRIWRVALPVRVEKTALGESIASTLDGKFWMQVGGKI
jgi:hypothetical protein